MCTAAWDGKDRRKRLTGLAYKTRAALDDLRAIEIEAVNDLQLVMLHAEAGHQALLRLHARIRDHEELLGQIRNGKYEPEQVCAPRLKATA